MSGRACSLPVGDSPEEDRARVYYYSIFPNMLLSLHPDYVMVHTLWPSRPTGRSSNANGCSTRTPRNNPASIPTTPSASGTKSNRQDWHVCELSQLGVSSRAYSPSPYSPRESLSAAFDREVVRAMHAEIG